MSLGTSFLQRTQTYSSSNANVAPFSASQENSTCFSFACVALCLHLFKLHKTLQQPQNVGGNTPPCCFTSLCVWLCSLPMTHLPSSHDTASAQRLPPSSSPSPFPALPGTPAKTFPRRLRRRRALKSTTRLLFKLLLSYFTEAAEEEVSPFSPPFPRAPQRPSIRFVRSINSLDLWSQLHTGTASCVTIYLLGSWFMFPCGIYWLNNPAGSACGCLPHCRDSPLPA